MKKLFEVPDSPGEGNPSLVKTLVDIIEQLADSTQRAVQKRHFDELFPRPLMREM